MESARQENKGDMLLRATEAAEELIKVCSSFVNLENKFLII